MVEEVELERGKRGSDASPFADQAEFIVGITQRITDVSVEDGKEASGDRGKLLILIIVKPQGQTKKETVHKVLIGEEFGDDVALIFRQFFTSLDHNDPTIIDIDLLPGFEKVVHIIADINLSGELLGGFFRQILFFDGDLAGGALLDKVDRHLLGFIENGKERISKVESRIKLTAY